jgi:type I restriction enzyme M protein
MSTLDIVQKLWNLCHVLRDDGVTYHEYVTELTFLLFLKMLQETNAEEGQIPEGHRWKDLVAKEGNEQLNFYKYLLLTLGTEDPKRKIIVPKRVQQIFADSSTALKHPRNLAKLVSEIDKLDWYSAKTEGLGDLYEGLLEKNASEKKSGAGQYFTPRPLIDEMVELVQPRAGEIIHDPALGTAGFLIAADRYIKAKTDNLYDLKTEQEKSFQISQAFIGVELVQDTHRMALMNAMLHDIQSPIYQEDTLSPFGETLPKVDVILTNPPFGTKKGGDQPTRSDFTFPTSNKQLAFMQHIYRSLKPNGRAAVVLPDNVLFEDNTGRDIRRDLMEKCNLHTILRLPTGIFYAQGVKTNVLFFSRGKTDKGNTKDVWIYDMRTNMPAYGKRTPFTKDAFKEFSECFGDDPYGKSKREDQGEEGRFRCFSREEIEKRGDNLDISWLHDENVTRVGDLPEPDEIAVEITLQLRTALEEMEALSGLLEGTESMSEVTA